MEQLTIFDMPELQSNWIYSEPPRDNTWIDYHRKLTERYSLFVRSDNPYYTNDSLNEVIQQEGQGYLEIINCDWSREAWNTTPYMWRVLPERNTITEVFASENTLRANFDLGMDLAGYRRNGEWSIKVLKSKGVFYYRDRIDGNIRGRYKGVMCFYDSGQWRISKGVKHVELQGAPDELLMGIARHLKNRKHKGFYDDELKALIEIGGLNETQL